MNLHTALRTVGVAVALMVGASACASSDAYRDGVECGSSTLVLVAQAVPTAQSIPCLAESLDWWSVTTVQIGDDGVTIEFNPQTGDDQWARLDFHSGCAAEATVELRVDGGCVSIGFSTNVDAERRSQLSDQVLLLSRQALQASLRSDFIRDAEL